jgi:hypothetical protein
MSSASDRCIRIILSASHPGYPKILALLLNDFCSSRVVATRKFSYEYVCLACAIWKTEAIDKNLNLLKNIIKLGNYPSFYLTNYLTNNLTIYLSIYIDKFSLTLGVADADSSNRKTARFLFWILRNRSIWQVAMDVFLSELEPARQKHIMSAIETPSADLSELLGLINGPFPSLAGFELIDNAVLDSTNGSSSSLSGVTKRSVSIIKEAKKPPPPSLSTSSSHPLRDIIPSNSNKNKEPFIESYPNEIEQIDDINVNSLNSVTFSAPARRILGSSNTASNSGIDNNNSSNNTSNNNSNNNNSNNSSNSGGLSGGGRRLSVAAPTKVNHKMNDHFDINNNCNDNNKIISSTRHILNSNDSSDNTTANISNSNNNTKTPTLSSKTPILSSKYSGGLVNGPTRIIAKLPTNKGVVSTASTNTRDSTSNRDGVGDSNSTRERKLISEVKSSSNLIEKKSNLKQDPNNSNNIPFNSNTNTSKSISNPLSNNTTNNPTNNTKNENSQIVNTFTIDTLKSMTESSHWQTRLQSFEAMHRRLEIRSNASPGISQYIYIYLNLLI